MLVARQLFNPKLRLIKAHRFVKERFTCPTDFLAKSKVKAVAMSIILFFLVNLFSSLSAIGHLSFGLLE